MNRKCSPTTFPHSSALLPKVGWGMSSPGAVLDPQNLVIYTWCTIEQVSMLLIRCPQTVFLNCMAWKWCYRYPHGPWQKKVPYSCKSNQINIFLYILPDISTLYQFQTKTSISIHSLFFFNLDHIDKAITQHNLFCQGDYLSTSVTLTSHQKYAPSIGAI